MSIELNFPFTTPSNYVYDSDKVEITGSKAKLKEYDPSGEWTEDFVDDTDFTYDNMKAEFTGGKCQQKDTSPEGCVFQATFQTDEDADFGVGNLNGGLIGGASWDAGGYMDLTGRSGKQLTFNGDNFEDLAGSGARGCIRFKVNLQSTSPINQILELSGGGGNANAIIVSLIGTTATVVLYDSSNTAHTFYGYGIPTSGWHVWEINFDFDGTSRLFVDGVSEGSLNTSSWTRTNNVGTFYWGGRGSSQDFYIDDIVLFDDVVHTSSHADELPYSYNITKYLETSVTCPQFDYAGIEDLQSFDSFSITENGSPKFIVNDKYWDGGAWASSDGTYAQASSKSDVNTNIGTLTTSNTMIVKVVFPASNTNSDVDDLQIDYTGQTYYTDNPTIVLNATFRNEALDGFTETSTKPANTEVKYILKKGTSWYYWTGSAWIESDLTYAKSNTETEVIANIATLVVNKKTVKLGMFLHSEAYDETPELDIVSITFNFTGAIPDEIETCIVWGYTYDLLGYVSQDLVYVELVNNIVRYKQNIIIRKERHKTTIPDDNGYFDFTLVENENMYGKQQYVIMVGDRIFYISVPNQDAINIVELL